MKNIITTVLLLSGLTVTANGDQKATMTCRGSKIILSVRSPYLGENSAAT